MVPGEHLLIHRERAQTGGRSKTIFLDAVDICLIDRQGSNTVELELGSNTVELGWATKWNFFYSVEPTQSIPEFRRG